MSNWFEDHPAKSIVTYTLVLVGATWGVSRFVIADNRVLQMQAEIEAEQARSTTLREKIDVVEGELARAREDARQWREALVSIPEAVPALMERIKDLTDKCKSLETQLLESGVKSSDDKLVGVRTIHEQSTFHDERSGLIVAVQDVSVNGKASLRMVFPDELNKTIDDSTVGVGSHWDFDFEDRDYRMLVTSVSYIGGYVELTIAVRPKG